MRIRRLIVMARQNETVKRSMTVPGLSVLVAVTYVSAINDAQRFAQSSSVGTYVSLMPRRFQFGEDDYTCHIPKPGDTLLRTYLFEAAGIILHRIVEMVHRESLERLAALAVLDQGDRVVDITRPARRMPSCGDIRRPRRESWPEDCHPTIAARNLNNRLDL